VINLGQAEKSALKRFGRNVASVLISGAVAYTTGKPYMIALSPVINAFAKWLRDKFKLQNIPI